MPCTTQCTRLPRPSAAPMTSSLVIPFMTLSSTVSLPANGAAVRRAESSPPALTAKTIRSGANSDGADAKVQPKGLPFSVTVSVSYFFLRASSAMKRTSKRLSASAYIIPSAPRPIIPIFPMAFIARIVSHTPCVCQERMPIRPDSCVSAVITAADTLFIFSFR